MLWQEDKKTEAFVVPDTVADLSFRVDCKMVPLDHAQELSDAVLDILPWMADEPYAGVHMIHGASTGNGWQRPEDDTSDGCIYLSRRSRMRIRMPKHRHEDAELLVGQTIRLGEHDLTFGDFQVKKFSPLSTLFSRYVIVGDNESEEAFVSRVSAEMKDMGITLRKALCGIGHRFKLADGPVNTMSIMVADLDPQDAVTLQQEGIGEAQKMGFGLFIPHKGIKAVGDMSESSHFDGTA